MYKKTLSKTQLTPGSDGVLSSLRSDESDHNQSQTPATPLIVIEPNPLLREGLSRLLEGSRYEIVGCSPSFAKLCSSPRRPPELILIGGDEVASILHTIEQCKEAHPSARRVVFKDVRGEHLSQILAAGAHACLGRDATFQALIMTLDLTMLGVSIVCSPLPHVASSPLIPMGVGNPSDELQARAGMAEAAHRLSSREVAILECLVHGDSNKLIARKFQIAESTVKVHIKAILRKLRAANRTQAAIWAMTHLSRDDSDPARVLSAAAE